MKLYQLIKLTALISLTLACSNHKIVPTEMIQTITQYSNKPEQISLLRDWCEKGYPSACLLIGKEITIEREKQLSIMQSTTLGNESNFVILVNRPIKTNHLRFFIMNTTDRSLISFDQSFVSFNWSKRTDFQLVHLIAKNLKPDTDYELVAFSDDESIIDRRYFTSLKKSPNNKLSFAITSCMDDHHPQQKSMWSQLSLENPEILLMIGDNVYADTHIGLKRLPDAEDLLMRYRQTREKLDVFYWKKLVPTYAVWDDHDYGFNNGDKTNPNKIVANELFTAFFPNKLSNDVKKGPGLSYSFPIKGHYFYFLDNRTFRDSEHSPEGEHFGVEQEQWLFDQFKTNNAPTFIISGDQFFGTHKRFESYQALHPIQFKKFYDQIIKKAFPITLISGDRHFIEVSKDSTNPKKPIYELTSSAIHAKVYNGTMKDYPNPKQIYGKDGQVNYMMVESVYNKNQNLHFKAMTENNQVIFENDIVIK